MSRFTLTLIVFCGGFVLVSPVQAAKKSKSLIRLEARHGIYEGKTVAQDEDYLWLLSRDGRLSTLAFGEVVSFKKVSPRFKGFSTTEVRDELRREYRGKLEVVAKGHYVVCAPRGRARDYAALFEDIYNSYRSYFRVRNLKLTKPEFPLIAIVFPDHVDFTTYAAREKVRASRGLLGYYHPVSNRVALFDPGQKTAATESDAKSYSQLARLPDNHERFARLTLEPFARTGVSGNGLRDTIVHEATHQVAFNTGLHSRIGRSPKWIVEGLATVFEAPGIRGSSTTHKSATRINRERFLWFSEFAQKRRKKQSLEEFVASDRMFSKAVLDAYSQAWALSLYLIETRPGAYVKFLRKITKRDPLTPYEREARIFDFQQAFGKDLDLLEAGMLRYIRKQNAR